MLLVKPSYEIVTEIDAKEMMQRIELAGRTCYKSEANITPTTCEEFCRKIVANGHESVLEHESIQVRFIIDRGVSHELVRHRLCAYSQESTRYCNYKGGVTFVIPPWIDIREGEYPQLSFDYVVNTNDGKKDPATTWWFSTIKRSEECYLAVLRNGWTAQQARSVLPNSVKTEIVCTTNIREWRHILRLRTASAAHPQMREVMCPLLENLKHQLPVLFGDI